MPPISKEKKEKIQEQILFYLFNIFPRQVFTSDISKEVARDEEFIKNLLLDMESKKLIIKITKNPHGIRYERRLRWRLSNETHSIYDYHQKVNKTHSEIREHSLF